MLDVSDRLIVIVGGGAVAARKARGVIKAGAKRVRAVSPAFDAALPAMVERVQGPYESKHLEGVGLVFAATNRPEVNEAVVRDARSRGVLVARADSDDVEPGDFATPAHFREGPVIVSVLAGSAALSASIRDAVAERFDPRWSMLADMMQTLRPLVLRTIPANADRRAKIFRALAGDDALVRADQGLPGMLAWLAERYPEFKNA
jgi:precorrin-2 dehydrogenase/sirohydrochlorin ferrochelatase